MKALEIPFLRSIKWYGTGTNGLFGIFLAQIDVFKDGRYRRFCVRIGLNNTFHSNVKRFFRLKVLYSKEVTHRRTLVELNTLHADVDQHSPKLYCTGTCFQIDSLSGVPANTIPTWFMQEGAECRVPGTQYAWHVRSTVTTSVHHSWYW